MAQCLHQKVADYWGVEFSSTNMVAKWNDSRTRADITVHDSERTLAKYRVEQLSASIVVEGSIIDPTVVVRSSADAKAAADRSGRIVSPCLDEGGF